ncbi:MAG: hypothetical protein ACFCUU_07115, partial [Cyclobacteriaceae bacterium]
MSIELQKRINFSMTKLSRLAKHKLVWALGFWLQSLQLMAVSYYVSPEGSNSNNGTSAETPFATIQHAHNQT